MKSIKFTLVTLGSIGILFLGACNNSEPAAKTETVAKTDHTKPSKGGQVVEVGKYHLEFVTEPENKGTHLDFYLLSGDKHEIIPNAKVTAQVKTPKGEQKTLNFTYDQEGKHYAADLPESAAGEYQVVVLSDINGEKVNGRFSFNR
ncbi:copper resistance protein CopC [Anabaena sp. UHCC 0253]|uniref:copper resistance protein CopC n=1 Tax=Anabaena sp. UHCC 0253 TaxID=2590019 RepID=UPI00144526BE|nr:copper resistance protein CopC [Anabaena sp. UHCC 0253]MTJ52905.1 copper resistance protein CopC [Anabaena sp. UHCC 0253]